MRRKVKNRNKVSPDAIFQSEEVSKFINTIMKSGKKNIARKIFYMAMDEIKEKAKSENPIEVFREAVRNVGPQMEVRSRRIGGANYQVPKEVRPERRQALAFKWILEAARGKKGMPIHRKLADEIISASKNEGEAITKRDNTHKMAESNKAFAHFAW